MSDRGKSIFKNGKLGILDEWPSCYLVSVMFFFCGQGKLRCLEKGFIVIVIVSVQKKLIIVIGQLVAAKV